MTQRAHKVDELGFEGSMTTYRDQLFSISKSPHAKLSLETRILSWRASDYFEIQAEFSRDGLRMGFRQAFWRNTSNLSSAPGSR